MRYGEEKSLSEVIKQIIQKNRQLKKGLDNVNVKEVWAKVIGRNFNILKYTENVYLQKGTLFICISSASLRQELSIGKQKIAKLINDELGENIIKKIVFR